MTTAVAKFAARKMLKGEMQKYAKKDVAGEYVSPLTSSIIVQDHQQQLS
jgi:hypothetical protein